MGRSLSLALILMVLVVSIGLTVITRNGLFAVVAIGILVIADFFGWFSIKM